MEMGPAAIGITAIVVAVIVYGVARLIRGQRDTDGELIENVTVWVCVALIGLAVPALFAEAYLRHHHIWPYN